MVSTKLDTFSYLTVKTASCYVPSFLTQYRRVTDRQTDGQTDGRNCYSQYSACNASIARVVKMMLTSLGEYFWGHCFKWQRLAWKFASLDQLWVITIFQHKHFTRQCSDAFDVRWDIELGLLLFQMFTAKSAGESILKIDQHLAWLQSQKQSGTFFPDKVNGRIRKFSIAINQFTVPMRCTCIPCIQHILCIGVTRISGLCSR